MYKTLLTTLFLLVASLSGPYASAQRTEGGLYSSPKGFGISIDAFHNGKFFSSFDLFAEMNGVYDGRCGSPGVKFNYSIDKLLLNFGNDGRFALYAGPGVALGYLTDNTINGHGMMLALSGNGGLRVFLSKGYSLDLSLTLEVGFHLSTANNLYNNKLQIYKNGLREFWWPQLSITRQF